MTTRHPDAHELSLFRLYLLRATYLLLVVGLGLDIWPLILHSSTTPPRHMQGVVWAVLGAIALVAVLGLRYPVRLIPLLLFELTWKAIWVIAIGYPLWRAGTMTAAVRDTWQACLMGLVICPIAIPWPFVMRQYLRAPGDRWRSARVSDRSGLDAGEVTPVL